jgi:hypothetical protein
MTRQMTFHLLCAALGIVLLGCDETAPTSAPTTTPTSAPTTPASVEATPEVAAPEVASPDAVGEDLTRSNAMVPILQNIREQETRAFLGSLATQVPATRMASLQTFAAQHGLPNFVCPALEH